MIRRVFTPAATVLLAAGSAAFAGPDVIVGEISGVWKWGSVGSITGYTIGTTSCNIGDEDAEWFPIEARHPVIAQNFYRLRPIAGGGVRLEQIGLSWLKHSGSTVAGDLCGTCNGNQGYVLGVGCSDPYSSTLNGDQIRMGPRSEVNPWTGAYPYPYELGWDQAGDAVYKRIQVASAHLDPAQNPGALYFAESQYICTDEPVTARYNNVSYRRTAVGPFVTGGWTLQHSTPIGLTMVESPAIFAWRDHGSGINAADAAVHVNHVDVPGDGRIYLASRCYDVGGGQWRYEYALYNMNSDRAVGRLAVPVHAAVNVTSPGMAFPQYHSGEPFSNQAWTHGATAGETAWATEGFVDDANANAARWGSLYNFWFVADRPPSEVAATLGLFKPGSPASVTVTVVAPAPPPPSCPVDANGDGRTNAADLSVLLNQFGGTVTTPGSGADFNGDGVVNSADLSVLLATFGCGG